MYQSIPNAIISPPGNPRAFDPCSAPHSVAFDANKNPTHRAFDPSKKCWSSVARKKDFVLHDTSHNSSWFSTTYKLIYVISSVLKKFRKYAIEGLEFSEGCEESCFIASTFEEFVYIKSCEAFL